MFRTAEEARIETKVIKQYDKEEAQHKQWFDVRMKINEAIHKGNFRIIYYPFRTISALDDDSSTISAEVDESDIFESENMPQLIELGFQVKDVTYPSWGGKTSYLISWE